MRERQGFHSPGEAPWPIALQHPLRAGPAGTALTDHRRAYREFLFPALPECQLHTLQVRAAQTPSSASSCRRSAPQLHISDSFCLLHLLRVHWGGEGALPWRLSCRFVFSLWEMDSNTDNNFLLATYSFLALGPVLSLHVHHLSHCVAGSSYEICPWPGPPPAWPASILWP